ncbi:MAG: DNA repair protein RecO [Muribaculaceae bacterium]|nr:DNA repair protein RecO [Muribaculaceae bacterium]
MNVKLRGVVLNVLKYNDKHNISHIYTREMGMMPFVVRQGTTAAAAVRRALMMPLSVIEFEASVVPSRELSTLHDVRRAVPLASIYADPVKNAVAMFISELLSHTIQEREPNEGLYRYIESAVQLLEASTRGTANFHICFLYHLGSFIGIQPDVGSYREGYWFNMNDGVFMPYSAVGARFLPPEQAQVIKLLSRMTFENMHLFRFNREQRNIMLDTIIAYYRIHNSTIGTLRSPEILKQLFV